MADPAPPPSRSSHPAHVYGRISLWIVLALMAASVIFAGWRAIANWSSIRV